MERKWGVGRLPLLVSRDLSDRFLSQHHKTSRPSLLDPRAVLDQIDRMMNAWVRLDAEAQRMGARTISPIVIEAALSDGAVVKIVRDRDEAMAVADDDRQARVLTASEVAILIETIPSFIWPGKVSQAGVAVKPARFEMPTTSGSMETRYLGEA